MEKGYFLSEIQSNRHFVYSLKQQIYIVINHWKVTKNIFILYIIFQLILEEVYKEE